MKKRMLSMLLCLAMLLGMIPLVSNQTAEAVENLSFDVDYQYPFSSAEDAMYDASFDNLTKTERASYTGDVVWQYATSWAGFESLMNSTSESDKYIKIGNNIKHSLGKTDYKTLTVTADKVLDLNGYEVHLYDFRNKANGSDDYSQSKDDKHFNTHMISVQNKATLSIIDSSSGETGVLLCNAYMINPFENRIRRYTVRDLIWLDDGNLVVYSGTLQAGRSKNQTKETTWDKIKTVVGNAVTLATDIAGYATGVNSATGALEDAEFNFNEAIKEAEKKANEEERVENTLSTSTKPDGTDSVKEEKKSNPTSEAKSTDSSTGRNQTTAEKQAGKDSTQENKANENGTAKGMDAHSKLAEAQNAVTNAAVNKDKINAMVDSAFKLGESIASCFRSNSNSLVTQTILGTVVHVGNGSTFVSYGGTFLGHGMTSNNRDAVVECAKNGKIYIYGGTFEGRAGANIFNMVTTYNFPQQVTMYSKNADGSVKEITATIPVTETNGLKVLNYAGSTAYSTENIQTRGGVFRNYCEYNLLGLNADTVDGNNDHDSDTMTTFPGTKGCVNAGVESYDENLIRDGRIQLVDNYGDGCLVLMDEETADNSDMIHYRLFCNDEELRLKTYLTVYPNNNGLNSSYSFALKTRSNNADVEDLSSWLEPKDEEEDRSSVFGSTEQYFVYDINAASSEKIYVIPYLTDTDPYAENLDTSSVWYYNTPVLASNRNTKMGTFRMAQAIDDYTTGELIEKTYEYDYLAKLKWFTYKVYRVDPLTRENIPENGVFGADSPVVEVSYGASDDSLKCKLDLDKLGITYKNGEMYRIVLTVDEYVKYNHHHRGKSLPVASCQSSIVFQCRGYDEFANSSNMDDSYTPVQWVSQPKAGETAELQIVNGKTGQIDYETRSLFNINYQWFVVDKDGNETMIAGTDNIYRGESENGIKQQEFQTIQKNRAQGKDTYTYANTKALSSDASTWTQEDIHVRWDMTTSNSSLAKNGNGNSLSLSNNNFFYGNTDSCYIPEEYAGYELYCKVTAVNCYWPKNYDHIQVFYSHRVKIETELGITFDFNGDEGVFNGLCKEKKLIAADETGKVTIPKFEILDDSVHTLLGWSESPDATVPTYKAGQTLTLTNKKTLYAVYESISYVVTFNANGGSGGPGSMTVAYLDEYTIPDAIPSRDGMIFMGWSPTAYEPDNSEAYHYLSRAGQNRTMVESITYYAVWAKKPNLAQDLPAGKVYNYYIGDEAEELTVEAEESMYHIMYKAWWGTAEHYAGTRYTTTANLLGYTNSVTPSTEKAGEWYYWFEATSSGGEKVKSSPVIVSVHSNEIDFEMNHSGLLAGTCLSEYSFSSSHEAIKSVQVTEWTEDGVVVDASTEIEPEKVYVPRLVATYNDGYYYSGANSFSINGVVTSRCSRISPTSMWCKIEMPSVTPLRVWVEAEELTPENLTKSCSSGGSATYDPYSSTLLLDNAKIVVEYSEDNDWYEGIYCSGGEYDGDGGLLTIALKGDCTIKGYRNQNSQALRSNVPVRIVQEDDNGKLKTTDGEFITGEPDANGNSLYLNAPLTIFGSDNTEFDPWGSLVMEEKGSYRGIPLLYEGYEIKSDVPNMMVFGDDTDRDQGKQQALFDMSLSDYGELLESLELTYIEIGVYYGIYVTPIGTGQEIYVNSANAEDVLHDGSSGKNPSVTYVDTSETPYQGILTLNNASLSSTYTGLPAVCVTRDNLGLTVEIVGNCFISVKQNDVGIQAENKRLKLEGDGHLTVYSPDGTPGAAGIEATMLTLNNSSIRLSGQKTGLEVEQTTIKQCDLEINAVNAAASGSLQGFGVSNQILNLSVGDGPDILTASEVPFDSITTGTYSDAMNHRYVRAWKTGSDFPVLDLKTNISSEYQYGDDILTGFPEGVFVYTQKVRAYEGDDDGSRVTKLTPNTRYLVEVECAFPKSVNPGMIVTVDGQRYFDGNAFLIDTAVEELVGYNRGSINSWDTTYVTFYYYFDYESTGNVLSGWVSGNGMAMVALDGDGVTRTRRIGKNDTFVFENVESGQYTLTITREGYQTIEQSVTMGNQAKTLSFIMDRYGDASLDGELTLRDVSMLFRWIAGTQSLSERAVTLADINQDGVTNLRDVALVYRLFIQTQ